MERWLFLKLIHISLLSIYLLAYALDVILFWEKVCMALVAKSFIYSTVFVGCCLRARCWETVWNLCVGGLLVSTLKIYTCGGVKGGRVGKREKSNQDAVSVEVWADPVVNSGTRWPCTVVPYGDQALGVCSPASTKEVVQPWVVRLWVVKSQYSWKLRGGE